MSQPASTTTRPLEADADQLIVVYSDADVSATGASPSLLTDELGPLLALPGLNGPELFQADADQRSGAVNQPIRRHAAVFSHTGDAAALDQAIDAIKTGDELTIWVYEPVGDFVRKQDALPGSRGANAPAEVPAPTVAADHMFMALTDPIPGQEAEFTRWYNEEHVPDVVAVEPYPSGRRFHLRRAEGVPAPWHFLSMYRFAGPVGDMHRILRAQDDAEQLTITEAIEPEDGGWVWDKL